MMETALRHARAALERAGNTGSALALGLAYNAQGLARAANRVWHDAIASFEQAIAIGRSSQTGVYNEPATLAGLAEARLEVGDTAAARATAAEAVEVARQRGARYGEAYAQLALARILLRTQGVAAGGDIQAALDTAVCLIEETGARVFLPFAHEQRAELARLLGDAISRERELQEAHRLFVAIGAAGHAARLAKELGLPQKSQSS